MRRFLGLVMFAAGVGMSLNVIVCGPEAFGFGRVSVVTGTLCGFVVSLTGLRLVLNR